MAPALRYTLKTSVVKGTAWLLAWIPWVGQQARSYFRVTMGQDELKFSSILWFGRTAREPDETRIGCSPRDTSPFYQMDARKLRKIYHGETGEYERRNDMLYADLTGFALDGMVPVANQNLSANEAKVDFLATEYHVPSSLAPHAKSAVDCFKALGKISKDKVTGDWENNLTVRLKSREGAVFTCHKADYFAQVATNLTMDWASDKLPDRAWTLRSGVERPKDGKLVPISESILANTFGTAIMFYDRELKGPLVRYRRKGMGSIDHEALHCTVSGVLKVNPGIMPGSHGLEFFRYGTDAEIMDETNLKTEQYLLFPMAFARELPRAGKPQLFYLAVSLVRDSEFREECKKAWERHEYVETNVQAFFGVDSTADLNNHRKFTYEGWACRCLARDFVEANRGALRQRVKEKMTQS